MKLLKNVIAGLSLLCIAQIGIAQNRQAHKPDTNRRIIHIVNFVRELEPRDPAITEEVLYQTVKSQVDLLNKYHLPATFLLQYDALIDPRYQKLLKTELGPHSEIGGWWEITQPHVEAAGLKWRGRYPWDWRANIGFSTGYSPKQREKLVDVYMAKFKQIFGYYPKSMASWFIDEYSLAYMYKKYHIQASANCKDQIGTDGYNLWGGYWNQAYYPSRLNAYMPAQTIAGQIGVPIFRMLGSDPIYQYDNGLGGNIQGVQSLEPVYERSGANRAWVEWLLKSLVNEPCLSFAYTQAGQENSFTWDKMKDGLQMQFPIFDSLRRAGKVRIETMAETGRWFKNKFPLTPATAVTVLDDYRNQGNKTIWYNSRYYRANLLWKGSAFRFRDIHLFDERYPSAYLYKAGTSTQCIYNTLPLVDGFLWSKADVLAGLRIMQIGSDGKAVEINCGSPIVTEKAKNVLQVECKDGAGETFRILFFADRFEVACQTSNSNFKWALELKTAPGVNLPFKSISNHTIKAEQDNFDYHVTCNQGRIEKGDGQAFVFRLLPANNKLVVDCNTRLAEK